jgi:hypothetical protein
MRFQKLLTTNKWRSATWSNADKMITRVLSSGMRSSPTIYIYIHLLGYNAMSSIESQLTFRRNTLSPFSGSKNKPSKKPAWKQATSRRISPLLAIFFHIGFLIGLDFDLENGGDIFLQNVTRLSTDYTALQPKSSTLHNHRCGKLKFYKIISHPICNAV